MTIRTVFATVTVAFALACGGAGQVDAGPTETLPDPQEPADLPPVITETVQQTYEFTMTLPEGAVMLTNGIVATCPEQWTEECPEYYAFKFKGDYAGEIPFDFSVSIDQADTWNLPNVSDEVEVTADGHVTVTPHYINDPPRMGDDGVLTVDEWSTGAARARSKNHAFLFQLNAMTTEQAKINEIFASLMSTFVVTVQAE